MYLISCMSCEANFLQNVLLRKTYVSNQPSANQKLSLKMIVTNPNVSTTRLFAAIQFPGSFRALYVLEPSEDKPQLTT